MPAIALIGLFFVGFTALVAGNVKAGNVHWDPVWLGGEGPWGIKIYHRTEGLTAKRGWRLEIIYDGLFCLEKTWLGTAGRRMRLEMVQAYAQQWIAANPDGGPCHR